MFKTLLKTRIYELGYSLSGGNRAGKKKLGKKAAVAKNSGKTLGMVILIIYIFGVFGYIISKEMDLMCKPFYEAGHGWLYFTIAGLMAMCLMFVLSSFTAMEQLYKAKDNELLLSMPIKPKYILLSRLTLLLIMNALTGLLVFIPTYYVFIKNYGFSINELLSVIICFIGMVFFSLALTCILGFLLYAITVRTKNKTIVSLVLYAAFFGAYFYLYSKMNTYIVKMVANGEAIGKTLKKTMYPFYLMGNSIIDGKIIEAILFLIIAIIPMIVVYYVLSVSFIKLVTTKKGFKKKEYVKRELKQSSYMKALIRKEFNHLGNSPMYIMNALMGVALVFIMGIMIIIWRDKVTEIIGMGEIGGKYIGYIGIAVICFLNSMNMYTAPSISLEGNNLWILQSSPVSSKDILLSKLYANCIICFPTTIFTQIVMGIVFEFSLFGYVVLILLPLLEIILFGIFGLVINLKFPKLKWTSEVKVIKQSASTMIGMLSGMGLLILLIILFIATSSLISIDAYFLIVCVIFAIATVILYRYLVTIGAKKFSNL